MTTAEMLRKAAEYIRDNSWIVDEHAGNWALPLEGQDMRVFADALEQRALTCDRPIELLGMVHPVHPQPEICEACVLLNRS